MGVTVEVPYDMVREVQRETENTVKRVFNNRREQIGDAFISVVEPFVPKDKGYLRASATIVNSSAGEIDIRYSRYSKNGYDVAYRQYTDTGYQHDGVESAYWDQVAMDYAGDVFIDMVEDILKK